jgi:hypothetical protein
VNRPFFLQNAALRIALRRPGMALDEIMPSTMTRSCCGKIFSTFPFAAMIAGNDQNLVFFSDIMLQNLT